MTHLLEGVQDVTFGSVAGMVSKVFEHPFDLTKVRLQSQVMDHTARFNGPLDCLTQTWRNEGIRGLYRGLPAPIVGAMAENATLFLSYGKIQHAIRWYTGSTGKELDLPHLALAGAGAGAITSFLLTPIELVKCKMQVQMLSTAFLSTSAIRSPGPDTLPPAVKPHPNFRSLPGPLAVLASIVRTYGLRGLWLGQTGTLIRETGGGAAWFASKEAVASYLLSRRASSLGISRSSLTKKDLQLWESAVGGAVAGVAYNVVLFPADSVKSAIQTEEELRPRAPGVKAPTFWGMAGQMYRKQGVKGLYAGMGITVARAVPSSALIFLIYDGLVKHFG
ncbi:mitochondrial carrier [Rickenella mellea]|uniref:Mitochondrial carrier n=1 Tax=Rickenella mellea TaxID=50990 RepID=A0A4Y7QCN5_9AGAM|nr:mitochondrial carrier [Rickenella mellea]